MSVAADGVMARREPVEMRQRRVRGEPSSEGRSLVPDLISIPEAARHLGLHPDTLYRLCRTGQFPPAIQIGSRWRVSVPRLDRYLHSDSGGVSPG